MRFAVRHPVWSSIRTVTASIYDSVESMVLRLLPDLKNTCQIRVGCQGCDNLNELEIGSLNTGVKYEIASNADKPYPTTRLEIVMPNDIVAQMDMGKRNEHDVHQICRWIRTPFQTKAYEKGMMVQSQFVN